MTFRRIKKKNIPRIKIPVHWKIPLDEMDEAFDQCLNKLDKGDYGSALKYLNKTSKTTSKYFHLVKAVCLFNVHGNSKTLISEFSKRSKDFVNSFAQGRFDAKSFELLKRTIDKWKKQVKIAYETAKKALDIDPDFEEARQFADWIKTTTLRDLDGVQKITSETLKDKITILSPPEFEKFVAYLFSKMDYEVQRTTYTADFGADIVAQRGSDRIVIQVKRYIGANVGAGEVQQALGSMWKYKANHAILVTTSSFTVPAREQAKGSPIELWDKKVLDRMIEETLFGR